MRAVVLDGRGGIAVREIPEPTPGDGDVVIAPAAVGICGTDLHLAEGDYPTGRFPVVPGHEFAGTVVATGDAVTGLAVGDRVCVDPNIACGNCPECAAGAVNLCPNLVPIGVTSNGACAERVLAPASVVHPLADDVDMAAGALIEPLACVLHALDRLGAGVQGRRTLIYGAGSIGLLAAAVLSHDGASDITVVEPSPVRREAALEFGATAALAPGERTSTNDVDLVIEASGHPSAVADALLRLANRGTLLQMGVVSPSATIELHPYDLFDRELSIIGSQSLAGAFPAAVNRIRDFKDLGRRMVTHTFGLDEYAQALAAVRSDAARKVQVIP